MPVTNPATGEVIAEVPYATAADVDRAVRAAHAAFLKWREVPVVDRVQVLYRYKTLLEKHANEVARDPHRAKTARPPTTPRMEVRRAIQMVEVACGMPSLMMGDSLERRRRAASTAIPSASRIGVCAGITPFNFPAMVPMWMYPVRHRLRQHVHAEAVGKSSADADAHGVELLHDAGLPAGVFNLIHGGKVAVDALLHHPLVRRFRSSDRRRWRSTSTRPRRPKASACRRWAARRIIWW